MSKIGELKKWLIEHKSEIPQKQNGRKTLMDYLGCRTLENPWSELYCFFLDNGGEHHLGNLFIDSIGELIGFSNDWMIDYEVSREFPVKGDKEKSRKRIDILITAPKQKHAIIIENKVHHTLENSLDLYTSGIRERGYTEIKKLVLVVQDRSWEKEKAKEDEYYYKTHKEFMDIVKSKLNNYSSQADPFYLKVLENFMQNIMNVTNDMKTNDEQISFFIEHFESSKQVYGIYKSIISDYKKQLNRINFKLEIENPTIEFNEERQLIYLHYKENNEVLLTILLNYMWAESEWYFNKPFIRVVLELQGQAKISYEKLDNALKDKLKEHYHNMVTSFSDFHDNRMMHFAYLDIPVDEEKDIMPEGYVEFINKHITKQSPLYELGLKVIDLINL